MNREILMYIMMISGSMSVLTAIQVFGSFLSVAGSFANLLKGKASNINTQCTVKKCERADVEDKLTDKAWCNNVYENAFSAGKIKGKKECEASHSASETTCNLAKQILGLLQNLQKDGKNITDLKVNDMLDYFSDFITDSIKFKDATTKNLAKTATNTFIGVIEGISVEKCGTKPDSKKVPIDLGKLTVADMVRLVDGCSEVKAGGGDATNKKTKSLPFIMTLTTYIFILSIATFITSLILYFVSMRS